MIPRNLSSDIELSIILPCYNTAPFIADTLQTLTRYLACFDFKWEVLLVDDGSIDATVDIIQNLSLSDCRLLRLDRNYGKGHAVKVGMLHALGRKRIFMDADLPYELTSIPECLTNLDQFHIVVGSRYINNAVAQVSMSPLRMLSSRTLQLVVGNLILGDFYDTQCGFKGFSGELSEKLFPVLTVDHFAFDIEIYMLVRKAQINLKSIPVNLVNNRISTIVIGRDGLRIFWDLLKIVLRNCLNKYDIQALATLANQPPTI